MEILHQFFIESNTLFPNELNIQQNHLIVYSILSIIMGGPIPKLEKISPYIYYYEETITHVKSEYPSLFCNGHLLSLGWINYALNCNITSKSIGTNHFNFETLQKKPAKRLCSDLSRIINTNKNIGNDMILSEIENMKLDIQTLKNTFLGKIDLKNQSEPEESIKIHSRL